MGFEWYEAKSHVCFQDRYQLMGAIEHRVFVVVYTSRDDIIRIISACKANKRGSDPYFPYFLFFYFDNVLTAFGAVFYCFAAP